MKTKTRTLQGAEAGDNAISDLLAELIEETEAGNVHNIALVAYLEDGTMRSGAICCEDAVHIHYMIAGLRHLADRLQADLEACSEKTH